MNATEIKHATTRILVYYDETDPANKGWAWAVHYEEQDADGTYEDCCSSTLPHRRRDVSLETLLRSLRREVGSLAPREARATWRWTELEHDGPGWEWHRAEVRS